ncbi:MAG: hypothetical protein HYS27_28455 [Deltaproteobacteria bacterium]|nr:hypothetical protein [Deltaproteobacteria bacterium]
MPSVQLTQQAAALLKEVQRKVGLFELGVDQTLQQAQTTQADPAAPLGIEQVEKLLLQAMPSQAQVIQTASTFAKGYHPDNKNPRFLTQILSMRIEKDHDFGVGTTTPPRQRDPLYASFTLDPKADFMLLFNARDVDAKGNPLLMKVVVREGADLAKLDLTRYRTATGQMPDVVKVAKNASYVETKDIDETEFSFGDPLKQVSVASCGKQELSSSVWVRPQNVDRWNAYSYMWDGRQYVINPNARQPGQDRVNQGEQLDTTPVKTFDERVRLAMKAKDTLPADAWLDTPGGAAQVDVTLELGRGYIFEPGSSCEVNFNGMKLTGAVDKADAQLLGNQASSTSGTPGGNGSLRWLLSQQVSLSAGANPNGNDRWATSKAAVDLIYGPTRDKITVGANTLSPLADVTITTAQMAANKIALTAEPIADPNNDAVKVQLKLDDAFLGVADGASVKGWKMSVGYQDAAGKWVSVGERGVKSGASKAETFSFDVDDFDALQQGDKKLEVRLFNAEGVPAQRVILPFRDVSWAD